MANATSIYDKAMLAFCWLMRAQQAAERTNDFGETTAIREDMEHLERDAEAALNSIQRRAWGLTNRCDKIKAEQGGTE